MAIRRPHSQPRRAEQRRTSDLARDHALQPLALFRTLAHSYDISATWSASFRHAFLGRPAIYRQAPEEKIASEAYSIALRAGELLVSKPAESLRGLIIGSSGECMQPARLNERQIM